MANIVRVPHPSWFCLHGDCDSMSPSAMRERVNQATSSRNWFLWSVKVRDLHTQALGAWMVTFGVLSQATLLG